MATSRTRLLSLVGAAAWSVALLAGPAAAGNTYGNGDSTSPTPTTDGESQGLQGTRTTTTTGDPGSGALPFTGGDIAGMAAMGIAAVGGGIALAKSGRRKQHA